FCYEVIVFVLVNAEEELAIVARDVILHRFALRIEERDACVGKYLEVLVLILEVRYSLEGIVDHLQVGIFIHERVNIVITFTPFTVRRKEAAIGAEQEDAEIISRAVHRLPEILDRVLAIPPVNDKQVQTPVSRMSVRGKIESSIFRNVREHFIARSIEFGTEVSNTCESSP